MSSLAFVAALAAIALPRLDAAESNAAPGAPTLVKPGAAGWRYEEVRRIPAKEARQGVAVDREFVYAIDNFALAKYRKTTGERVASWAGEKGGAWIHLNAGIVHEGRIVAAHSNYPGVPMLSSIEWFDTGTLQPAGSHSLGRADGSLTWIDRRERSSTLTAGGAWIACFVHYGRRGGEPGRGPEWTRIVELDEQWRELRRWALPPELIAHVGTRGYGLSGGAFGPGGKLFATGHDEKELFVLDFPRGGSVLRWIATVPITAEGQAFAWDPDGSGLLYTVDRRQQQVIVGRVTGP